MKGWDSHTPPLPLLAVGVNAPLRCQCDGFRIDNNDVPLIPIIMAIVTLSFKEAASLMGCNALKREFQTKSGEKFVSLYYTWSYEDQEGNPASCLSFLHYSSNLNDSERNAEWVIAHKGELSVYQVDVDSERGNMPVLVVGRKADLGEIAGLEED